MSKEQIDKLEVTNYNLREKLLDLQLELEEAKIKKTFLEEELFKIESPKQDKVHHEDEGEIKIIEKLNSLKRQKQDYEHQLLFDKKLIDERNADLKFLQMELSDHFRSLIPSVDISEKKVLLQTLQNKLTTLETHQNLLTIKEESLRANISALKKILNQDSPLNAENLTQPDVQNILDKLKEAQAQLLEAKNSLQQEQYQYNQLQKAIYDDEVKPALFAEYNLPQIIIQNLKRSIQTEIENGYDLEKELSSLIEAQQYVNIHNDKIIHLQEIQSKLLSRSSN